MKPYLGLIELLLTLAIVVAFGFWQLRSVARAQAEDRARDEDSV